MAARIIIPLLIIAINVLLLCNSTAAKSEDENPDAYLDTVSVVL